MYIDRRRQRPSARRPEATSGRSSACARRRRAKGCAWQSRRRRDQIYRGATPPRRRRDEMLNGAQYIRAISRRCIHGNRGQVRPLLFTPSTGDRAPPSPAASYYHLPSGSVLIQPRRNRLLIARRLPFAVGGSGLLSVRRPRRENCLALIRSRGEN